MDNERSKGLGRQDQRLFSSGKFGLAKLAEPQIIDVQTTGTLLSISADLSICEQELAKYDRIVPNTEISVKLYRFYRSIGATEEGVRRVYLATNPDQEELNLKAEQLSTGRSLDQRKWASSQVIFKRLTRGMDPGVFYKFDDLPEWYRLLEDRTIPLDDILLEGVRVRTEERELLKVEVDWLRKRVETEDIVEIEEDVVEVESSDVLEAGEVPEVSIDKDFILNNWELYWTSKHWSQEDKYLTRIPTPNRRNTLKNIKPVLRGEVMIKPWSVLTALECYLSRDILQRAMAARLRHVPENIREWIKIKRGNDRILLAVPEEGTAVFFAGNRDDIYRNLPH